ncbi:MAG: ATP-binding protein [Campylobacterota bacterium]|nr:ATP-binding protein [Campylobacterota bacterium]
MMKHILNFWNYSIRYQLIVGTGVLLALIIVTFTYYTVTREANFLNDQAIKTAQNRCKMLAASSKTWVMSSDYVGLEEVINNFKIYDDLIFASIINLDGKIVADTQQNNIGKYVNDKRSVDYLKNSVLSDSVNKESMKILHQTSNYLDVAFKITFETEAIGWVHLRISQKSYKQMIENNIFRSILFIVIFLIVGFVSSYIIINSFTDKLQKLIDIMKQIRSGNRRVKSPENGVLEIKQISHEFNLMVETLNQNNLRLEKSEDDLKADITKRVKVEKDIRDLNENLEQIVTKRTKEVTIQMDKAQEANKSKSVFLANMSHELRTPLNAILGFSQLMSDSTYVNPSQKEYLEIINKSGSHLLSLINDILDMSKIEAGKIELNEGNIDLHNLLNDVSSMIKIKADSEDLQFIIEYDENLVKYVRLDEKKLRQILINILGNAIKYTDNGGVSFRIKSTCKDKNCSITFEIEDSGRGMNEDELKKVFEPFIQVSSSNGVSEGTGLGLAITHRFLKLMGAYIDVKSEPNHGTLFKFTINVDLVEHIDVEERVIDKKVIGMKEHDPKLKILMVEDQKENRLLLRNILENVGFVVFEAINGKDGVEKFIEVKPDFIWMDMRMPIMDGYEATQKIREIDKNIPIIALTASAFEDQHEKILQTGCNTLVHKPYQQNEIYETMQKYLDVEYIFQEYVKDGSETHSTLTKEMLHSIPKEMLDSLKEALIELNPDSIMQHISAIKDIAPNEATNMMSLASNYDYDLLLKLLEEE